MDCVILAGNRESYRAFSEKPNKAFLEIQGRTILDLMLEQLVSVPAIDRLFLVGPKSQIEAHLAKLDLARLGKPIQVFEQSSDLVNNIEEVIQATQVDDHSDRYLLILPSDIPLLTHQELIQFIDQCNMDAYDMVSGVTTSKALSQFYPTSNLPGIRMAYFYFKEGAFRINNMHMVRPGALKYGHYIRKTYAMRYQKELINILKMIWGLLGVAWRNPDGIYIYLGMSMARLLRERGFFRMAHFFSRQFTLERTSRSISKVLGTRFKIAITHYGGAAIDVDNESDYQAVVARYDEWKTLQKNNIETHSTNSG